MEEGPSHRNTSAAARWRRHASLDAGIDEFRSRQDSLSYTSYSMSPHSIHHDRDETLGFLDSSSSGHTSISDKFEEYPPASVRAGRLVAGLALAATLVLLSGVTSMTEDVWGLRRFLHDQGVAVETLSNLRCDEPYEEFGRLSADGKRWTPYEPTCSPPALLNELTTTVTSSLSTSSKVSYSLSWLQGRTVLLFGDHLERQHNHDFCTFVGGEFNSIGPNHPLSPPPFVNGIDEKFVHGNESDFEGSRPSLCYVEDYDFLVVSAFHYGFASRIQFEHESLLRDKHFHPPIALQDRLSHIVIPILSSLNRTPDLVEFSSGYWDLRHFSAVDKTVNGDPFSPLSDERLEWYAEKLSNTLADLGAIFPRAQLLWRAMHHPPRSDTAAFCRVASLDQLGRKVIASLNHSRSLSPWLTSFLAQQTRRERSTRALFLNRLRARMGLRRMKEQELFDDDLAFPTKPIRINPWGSLLLGQEHRMQDLYTPRLYSFLWSDIMLFELSLSVD